MQYLSELPEISSIGRKDDLVELELESPIEDISGYDDADPLVLVAKYAGDIIVVVGQVVELENVEGPHIWCRLKMKGWYIQGNI